MPNVANIRTELGALCTVGVEPYWVLERATELLALPPVTNGLAEGAVDADRVAALVSYLAQAVGRVQSAQHRVILSIVLGLDPKYLGLTAQARRTEAGERFRGGRRQVSWGTIRQYHEPRALDALAEVIAADCAASIG